MIYTPDGRTIKRKAGFCDNPFEIVVTEPSSEDVSPIDLIGSSVSYLERD